MTTSFDLRALPRHPTSAPPGTSTLPAGAWFLGVPAAVVPPATLLAGPHFLRAAASFGDDTPAVEAAAIAAAEMLPGVAIMSVGLVTMAGVAALLAMVSLGRSFQEGRALPERRDDRRTGGLFALLGGLALVAWRSFGLEGIRADEMARCLDPMALPAAQHWLEGVPLLAAPPASLLVAGLLWRSHRTVTAGTRRALMFALATATLLPSWGLARALLHQVHVSIPEPPRSALVYPLVPASTGTAVPEPVVTVHGSKLLFRGQPTAAGGAALHRDIAAILAFTGQEALPVGVPNGEPVGPLLQVVRRHPGVTFGLFVERIDRAPRHGLDRGIRPVGVLEFRYGRRPGHTALQLRADGTVGSSGTAPMAAAELPELHGGVDLVVDPSVTGAQLAVVLSRLGPAPHLVAAR